MSSELDSTGFEVETVLCDDVFMGAGAKREDKLKLTVGKYDVRATDSHQP